MVDDLQDRCILNDLAEFIVISGEHGYFPDARYQRQLVCERQLLADGLQLLDCILNFSDLQREFAR